ncbi:hypothetical protein [Microbacterium caowuchunii]|uniref:Uncharacterized protein n=1 Tax=Microbacterium caowuchunii TaxID=2614638 RepID=A0A5N0TIV7_9MICO|nr:hypothetical protein [Microbacterium caowuchunii]KAA9134364.1 hypothetical protein F6B40_06205 [Microbacterium caowuchunii]
MTLLLVLLALVVAAIAGTILLVASDGHGPVRTDRMRIPDRDPRPADGWTGRAGAPAASVPAQEPPVAPPEGRRPRVTPRDDSPRHGIRRVA